MKWEPIRYEDKNNKWTSLADSLELSVTMEDGEVAKDYIEYLIFIHKNLPKKLLWTLKDTNRIDVAEILILLYKKYSKLLGK